jgi:hypothetical protein
MNNMDKLTLELFTNKTQYRKYLSKNDPDKFNSLQEEREKILKYKQELLERTDKLISCPDLAISPLIQESFDNYVNVLIKEIETNKLEIKEFEDNSTDEETLFKNMDELNNYHPSPIRRETEEKNERKTFWNNNDDVFNYGKIQDGIFNHYPTNTSVRKRFVGKRNSSLP